jgi:hypothetical protein
MSLKFYSKINPTIATILYFITQQLANLTLIHDEMDSTKFTKFVGLIQRLASIYKGMIPFVKMIPFIERIML